jgi:hypothetical protein
MSYEDHNPDGNPCRKCGKDPTKHRVQHAKHGNPCALCEFEGVKHREYSDHKREKRNRYRGPRRPDQFFIGIDGEGQGRKDHRYVMLAAEAEDGRGKGLWVVENPKGLSTKVCLDFILGLPTNGKVFAYSFNYDLTMLLRDLDDRRLYYLFRPELRKRPPGSQITVPFPITWGEYKLNLQGTRFMVKSGKRRRTIWDIWKFYQSKFVSALEDWKIGSKEELARMRTMKDQRGEFDKLGTEEILAYCISECTHMATLARKLVEAHDQAGLKLRSFYGAGSTATCLLKDMGIRKIRGDGGPVAMTKPVAAAFFGGRFENSVIGPVYDTVYGYDISSAYPYQLAFLPCLVCGSWERTTDKRRMWHARAALVHYALGKPPAAVWGPFPFRERTGSIAFPLASGGGWVWRAEYLAGKRVFPHVRFQEAWVYESDCTCEHPFAKIPHYYRERLRIGKEGAGIVFKLGPNSVYGKLAQSVGDAPFQSWIWAGMITSGCRAQILGLMALHKDLSNLLSVATDGIYTRERLTTPRPRDTKTFDALDHNGNCANKPLGGGGESILTEGMFFARPGIYSSLNPSTEKLKSVRARGVGRATLVENWRLLIDGYSRGHQTIKLPNVTRFCGAKSSISVRADHDVYANPDETPQRFKRAPTYGQWVAREVELSLNPLPKREGVLPLGEYGILTMREFPRDLESTPYSRALLSPEARELKMAELERLEQPDGGDFVDYDE